MGAADLWALNSADIFAVNDFQTGPSVDFFILTIGYNWYHEVLGRFVSPKGSQSNSSSFRCFVIRLLCGLRVLQMRPQGFFPQDSGFWLSPSQRFQKWKCSLSTWPGCHYGHHVMFGYVWWLKDFKLAILPGFWLPAATEFMPFAGWPCTQCSLVCQLGWISLQCCGSTRDVFRLMGQTDTKSSVLQAMQLLRLCGNLTMKAKVDPTINTWRHLSAVGWGVRLCFFFHLTHRSTFFTWQFLQRLRITRLIRIA